MESSHFVVCCGFPGYGTWGDPLVCPFHQPQAGHVPTVLVISFDWWYQNIYIYIIICIHYIYIIICIHYIYTYTYIYIYIIILYIYILLYYIYMSIPIILQDLTGCMKTTRTCGSCGFPESQHGSADGELAPKYRSILHGYFNPLVFSY